MDSALSRPTVARRPLLTMMLTLSVLIVASLASATTAFAWDTSTYNCIALTPATADNQLPEDSTHTVTATVTGTQPVQLQELTEVPDPCTDPEATLVPKAGVTVYFVITSGPNAGLKATAVTDANGNATFTWSSSTSGTDVVEAYTAKEIDGEGNPLFIEGDPVYGQGDIAWASAVKNWLPPVTPPPTTPVVTPSGVPATTLVVSKKCQSRKFKISSASSNGTVTKYVLQVDGKTVTTAKGSSSTKTFTINSAKYSPGSHSIKLTTYFSNGSKVVKTGKFKRCAVRTAARRISPNFTG